MNFLVRFIGGKNRSFQHSWFKDKLLLEYSVERDACYCYACRFNSIGSDSLFANFNGFRDWKHAPGNKGSLSLHSSSRLHADAMVAWQQYTLNKEHHTSIVHRLDQLGEKVLQENRHYLKTFCEVILLCARQDIALQGHNEKACSENPGNFLPIVSLLSKHDDLFRHCYGHAHRNATYTSPSILHELASIICNEIKQAGCFSMLVDETKDISKQEQMSVVLRYVKQCNVYERFVGFVHVDAESLCAYILDTLASFDLSLFDCVSIL